MFLKKKKLRYENLLNNNTSMQTMPKIKTSNKIQKILDEVTTKTIDKVKAGFIKPKTDEEWKTFHKTNEEGIKKAYASKEGYFKDGNKLFIAGTRDMQDVMDWVKIPTFNFKESKIYKNIEPIFKEDKNIDYVVGHSAGGSAALELENNFKKDRQITSVTYNAPVFERGDPDKVFNEDMRPLRFAISFDPVSMFDMNAQTTFKAPDFNVEGISNLVKTYNDPTLNNIKNVTDTGMPDITMGLHSMKNNYSNPSTNTDFLKSAVEGTAVAKTLGFL